MADIKNAEYYINRAALHTEFKDIKAIYFLSYHAANTTELNIITDLIEQRNWKKLLQQNNYHTQQDNFWIVGFSLQSGQNYIAVINEYFEVMYREKFVYSTLIPDKEFISIPFKETSTLVYPLNPTSFFKRLLLRYLPHITP